ncbi:breast cancer metastasis-suppressor 1-like protein-A [Rhipicephalus microplus]|uniref:breast cancer metastasis-suppressor 1-like protein-A n=1 Tax=Rhipicephalus microplus TaxID=6941 RepID=UPI003F6AFA76
MARTLGSWLLTAFFRGSSYFEARSSKIPSVKECNNDNEGEEMGLQTPDSEYTNNEDSDLSFRSEDDSLEICENHCKNRLSEYIDDMADFERQLVHLQEQVYLELANQRELKLEDVKLGLASEYLQPLEDLQNNISKRIKVADILNEMKLNHNKRKYEAEEIAACPYIESGRALLQDSFQCELEEKIKRLEENHKNINTKKESMTALYRYTVETVPTSRTVPSACHQKKKPSQTGQSYVTNTRMLAIPVPSRCPGHL